MEHEKTPCPSPTCPICSRLKPKPKKLTLKERIQRQRLENIKNSEQVWESVKNRILSGEFDKLPIINKSNDRIKNILKNEPAIFEIKDNPLANGEKTFKEIGLFNPIDSGSIYEAMGKKYNLDPDWLKAIAYMENTHGYYDGLPLAHELKQLMGDSPSYRPMNVQYQTWKPIADQLGFTEWQIKYRVECNVEMGAVILSRIKDRIQHPTLEKVASIYNFTGAEQTRDYGAQVSRIYKEKLWLK